MAEAMLRAGARVAIWDNNLAAIERTRAELEALDLWAEFFHDDITELGVVGEAFQAVGNRLGPVDVLVNNAAHKMTEFAGTEHRPPNPGLAFCELDVTRFCRLVE